MGRIAMKREFSSSPWGFRLYPLKRYCQFMKSIGISDICLMFGDPGEFQLALQPERGKVEEYLEKTRDFGVRIAEIATTGDWFEELQLASLLGVKYFRVCEIWEDTPEMFESISKKLKELGKLAADFSIMVVVENHGGLLKRASACRELLETVDEENVKLNYDPANFLYYGEDPLRALEEVLSFIGFTHCKSVKYENGDPKYCRLSEGVIDYQKLLERLLSEYSGYLGLEYEEPEDVEKGTLDDFKYLQEVLENQCTKSLQGSSGSSQNE